MLQKSRPEARAEEGKKTPISFTMPRDILEGLCCVVIYGHNWKGDNFFYDGADHAHSAFMLTYCRAGLQHGYMHTPSPTPTRRASGKMPQPGLWLHMSHQTCLVSIVYASSFLVQFAPWIKGNGNGKTFMIPH